MKDDDSNAPVTGAKLTPNTLYAYEKDGSDYTLFVLDKDNYKCGDVKVLASAANVKYNDKSETINGMEAEDSAPIYMTYSTDTYKVITGSALKGYKDMTGTGNSVVLADKDNVIAAYINRGSDGISSTDTLYGVVKKSYKGTESNGSDTVVYLDLVTADGIKTVETEETNNKFSKGDIVSFTGTYEKANDDVKVVSDTQTYSTGASQGYIAIGNNWSDSSKLIRAYDNLYYGDQKVVVGAGKVVSDSTVIYIDEDGYVVDEGTPSKAEELANANGYYANAFVIVNSDNEIDLLVYETGNRIKDGDNKEVQLLTADGKAAAEANAKIKTAVDALKALTESQLKATTSSSDFITGDILAKDNVTYTVKSATKDVTATKATKAIKVNGTSLKAGDTVKVTVTVSATNGTSQDVELTLTLA